MNNSGRGRQGAPENRDARWPSSPSRCLLKGFSVKKNPTDSAPPSEHIGPLRQTRQATHADTLGYRDTCDQKCDAQAFTHVPQERLGVKKLNKEPGLKTVWRRSSGVMQGTHRVYTQGTHRVYTVYTQGTHTGHTQGTHRVHTVYTQGIPI